jgi:hypothetical protein
VYSVSRDRTPAKFWGQFWLNFNIQRRRTSRNFKACTTIILCFSESPKHSFAFYVFRINKTDLLARSRGKTSFPRGVSRQPPAPGRISRNESRKLREICRCETIAYGMGLRLCQCSEHGLKPAAALWFSLVVLGRKKVSVEPPNSRSRFSIGTTRHAAAYLEKSLMQAAEPYDIQ